MTDVQDGRLPRWRWGRPGLGPLAGAVATLSTLLQLMTPPVLGLADNGDFKRILRPLGLAAVVPQGQPPSFQYVWLHYTSGPATGSGYWSSEYVLIYLVRRVSLLLGFGPGFDVRLVGIGHALLLGVAVWLIVRALPGPLPLRVLSASLLILVLTDTRFVVYYNSFFTEPASLLALLFLIAILLHTGRSSRLTPLALLGFVVAAAALICSKSQNAALVVPLAGVLLARPLERRRRRLGGRWRGYIPGAVCAALLICLAVGYLHHQPPGLNRNNRYNAVFVELLGHSPNPAGDLVALGLSPDLARYAGRPIYVPGNATHDPHFAGFYATVTERKLATFYLTHPDRAIALAHRGATASMYLRPIGVSPPLGNQTVDSGAPPYYTSCKLCLFSKVSQAARSWSGVVLPGLWLAALATALALLRRRKGGATGRGTATVLLLLVSSAAISMTVALIGEGAFEIVKHLYFASACNALILVFIVHGVGLLLVQAQQRNRANRSPSARIGDAAAADPSRARPKGAPAPKPAAAVPAARAVELRRHRSPAR